jgi:mannose-6-phosphate isomerase-like protein (cupin superfamily)
MPGYRVTRLDEVPTIPPDEPGDPDWRPLQHYLRLEAFGANVYLAQAPGVFLIGEHDERRSGQEELYLVLSGRVRFTLDGEEVEGREGTVVTAAPEVVRSGIAMESGSAVFAVGATPHGRFESTWDERHFEDVPQAG